jgi:hypothetical protein
VYHAAVTDPVTATDDTAQAVVDPRTEPVELYKVAGVAVEARDAAKSKKGAFDVR